MPLFRRHRKERDLDAEIAQHLALETERRIEQGESPEAARAHARRDFGNVVLVTEVTRAMWWPHLFDIVEQDLRHGLRATSRLFRRDLGVTLVAILTLACAIGANTVVFSAINALILKSGRVGIGHPRALVDFGRKNSAEFADFFSYADFEKYRERHELFSGIAATSFPLGTGVHLDGGPVEVLDVAPVSGTYFDVLEIAPAAGRLLVPSDDREAAERVAVISDKMWRAHFGGRPEALGRRIRIGPRSYAIVGVTPPGLEGTLLFAPDIWLPLSTHPNAAKLKEPRVNYLALTGRLAPGASLRQAQAAMDAEPPDPQTQEPPIRLGHEIWLDSVKPIMAMLMSASAVLLLIACANVAGIGLARATSRRREIAVRLALGASRSRIVTQLLIETMALFLLAGVIGAGVAPLVVSALSTEADINIAPDWHVFAFTLALTLLAAVAAGLTPAFQTTRTDPGTALKDDTTTTYRRARSRKVLVAAQIALSLVLLVGCGLFLHTLRRLSTDLGFDPTDVQVVSLDLKSADISDVDGKTIAGTLVQRVSTVPGVSDVSLAWGVPVVGGQFTFTLLVPGLQAASPDGLPIPQNGVMPGYFRTLHIPIVKGRDFNSADRPGPPEQRTNVVFDWSADGRGVAIVNEALATRLWRDADPIGQHFYTCGAIVETCAVEVVGVVGDTRADVASFSRHEPMVYRPFTQSYMPQVFVIIRSDRPDRAAPAVREIVRGVNAEIPTLRAQSLDEAMGERLGLYRLGAATAGSMSGVGLLLASLGIYGVVAYGVNARRREIGIRTALGAQPGSVIRLMLREGLQLMVVGVVVGCAFAMGAATLIASAVPGVTSTDWPALILSAIAVGAIACAASYLPARSAAKTDPLVVLRQN